MNFGAKINVIAMFLRSYVFGLAVIYYVFLWAVWEAKLSGVNCRVLPNVRPSQTQPNWHNHDIQQFSKQFSDRRNFWRNFRRKFWPKFHRHFLSIFFIFGAGAQRLAKNRKKCQVLRPSQPPIPPKFRHISAQNGNLEKYYLRKLLGTVFTGPCWIKKCRQITLLMVDRHG